MERVNIKERSCILIRGIAYVAAFCISNGKDALGNIRQRLLQAYPAGNTLGFVKRRVDFVGNCVLVRSVNNGAVERKNRIVFTLQMLWNLRWVSVKTYAQDGLFLPDGLDEGL